MSVADSQVYACCRAIVRYIYQNAQSAGDKLPTQEKLRELLGFSHNSLSPAMAMLVESSMLSRQRRYGTIVTDPNAQPVGLWRIALPFIHRQQSPTNLYYSVLHRILYEMLTSHGFNVKYYLLKTSKDELESCNEFSRFGGLEDDLKNRKIDGILTPCLFSAQAEKAAREYNTIMCHLGCETDLSLRVVMDIPKLVADALEYAQSRGYSRPLLVMSHNLQDIFSNLEKHYAKECKDRKLCGEIDLFTDCEIRGEAKKLLTKIRQQPQNSRPDCMIVLNDMFAALLSSLMPQEDFTIELLVQSNLEIPLFYATPAKLFHFSAEQLVRKSLDLLTAHLHNPNLPPCEQKTIAQPE